MEPEPLHSYNECERNSKANGMRNTKMSRIPSAYSRYVPQAGFEFGLRSVYGPTQSCMARSCAQAVSHHRSWSRAARKRVFARASLLGGIMVCRRHQKGSQQHLCRAGQIGACRGVGMAVVFQAMAS